MQDKEQKAAAYKLLKTYAKLPAESREAMLPSMMKVAGNILLDWVESKELPGERVDVHKYSFDLLPTPEPLSVWETQQGLMYLVVALVAAIVNLPSFLILEQQSAYLKVSWRYLVLLVLSAPLLLRDLLTSTQDFGILLATNFSGIFFLSVANAAHVYLIYHAVKLTFVAHTLLLGSISTTFLAVWKIVSGQLYSRLEYLGIAANVFGAYLCCCEGGPLPRILFLYHSSRQRDLDGRLPGDIGIGGVCSI